MVRSGEVYLTSLTRCEKERSANYEDVVVRRDRKSLVGSMVSYGTIGKSTIVSLSGVGVTFAFLGVNDIMLCMITYRSMGS